MKLITDMLQSNAATPLKPKVKESEQQSKKNEILKMVEKKLLKGEIKDLNQDSAVVELPDGTRLSGKLSGNSQVKIGLEITFSTKYEDGKLVMQVEEEPISDSQKKLFSDVLKSNGFKETPENLKMLQDMIEHNMPLRKESISKYNQTLKAVGTENVPKAIFFIENDIRAGLKNTEILDGYLSGETKFSKQLSELSRLIADLEPSPTKDELLTRFAGNQTEQIKQKFADASNKLPLPIKGKIVPQMEKLTQDIKKIDAPEIKEKLLDLLNGKKDGQLLLNQVKDLGEAIKTIPDPTLKESLTNQLKNLVTTINSIPSGEVKDAFISKLTTSAPPPATDRKSTRLNSSH